jgi:chromosome segregation ATPase
MSNIVERARALGREFWQHKRHYDELAAEIERLREAIAEWQQCASVEAGLRREFLARAEKAEAEIERLTLERETWTQAYKATCAIADARQAEIERLRASNAQLVEALSRFLKARSPFWDGEDMDVATEAARAAIAKVVGQTKKAAPPGESDSAAQVF